MKTKKQIRKRIRELESRQKACLKNKLAWSCGKYINVGLRYRSNADANRYHSLQEEIDVLRWVLKGEE